MSDHNYSAREPLDLSTTDDPATFPRGTAPLGTQRWIYAVPLADGRMLRLAMGKKGRDALLDMLAQEEADDAADAEFLKPKGDGG